MIASKTVRIPRYAIALASLVLSGFATPTIALGESPAGLEVTALDRYVAAPDPHFQYSLLHSEESKGYRTYVLEMTSQKWLDEELVDRPLWKHHLIIVRPNEVKSETGLLFITGGNNDDGAPTSAPEHLVTFALGTQSVVAELRQVPNQSLSFLAEAPRKRRQDSIIAYTWDKYLRTGDEKWPLYLPMTKSAVRAMDTITAFLATPDGCNSTVDKFVVAGGSKRGWTTWTTAAVDKRVIGIMPFCIDVLNLESSLIHHYKVYGKYAPDIGDYVEANVLNWMGTPEFRLLMEMIDPFAYRKRLTLPKFILNATGDEFFVPDSSQFYFDALEGEKYLRYIPNTGHNTDDTDYLESMLAWYHAFLNNVPRPRFSWRLEEDGAIRVHTLDEPTEVRLWHATSEKDRNFQRPFIGDAYSSTLLEEQDAGVYIGRVPAPESGWTAYFVEMTYPSGTTVPFKFTTNVFVTPNVYPHDYKFPGKNDHAPGFIQK